MASKTYKWDDWSGGEYGILRPEEQKKNQFSGSNMLLYDNGFVGPRSGLKYTSGIGGGALAAHGREAIGYADVDQAEWVLYADTYVYSWTDFAWLQSVSVGTSVVKPGLFVRTAKDTNYLVTPGNGLDIVLHVASSVPTITPVTIAVFATIGSAASLYRDRMYISDDTTTARVRYSAANDYTSWVADNYFDVGDNTPIAWMGWSGSRLIIIKENMETWAYQGVPGRDTLVRLNEAQIPGGLQGRCVTTTKNGDIWAWVPGKAYPHKLVGSRFVGLRHLTPFPDGGGHRGSWVDVVGSMSGTHEDDGVMGVIRSGDAKSADEDRWVIAIRRNSAWSFHDLVGQFVGTSIIVAKSDAADRALILTGSSAINGFQFAHVNNLETETDDPYGELGDYSGTISVECTFDTSTYIVSSPKETRVHKVIVELDSLSIPATSGAQARLSAVDVVGLAADGEEHTLDFGSWTHAISGRAGGYRAVFTSDGDMPMTQFRVHLECRGVSIKTIAVVMEEDDENTRG